MGRVMNEVEVTRRRRNREIAAQAALDKAVQASVHGGKKGTALLRSALKDLNDGST